MLIYCQCQHPIYADSVVVKGGGLRILFRDAARKLAPLVENCPRCSKLLALAVTHTAKHKVDERLMAATNERV